MHKFSTFVFSMVVRRDEWGEMENVYMAKKRSYSVVYLPKIIKIYENLTKFWEKQFVQFVLRHGVDRHIHCIICCKLESELQKLFL